MAIVGSFDSSLNRAFRSSSGAYTSITQAEIDKQTYNVKACIRTLLVQKLGRTGIPKAKSGSSQTIHFLVCPHTRISLPEINLQCKFSKPDHDEMSLYLSRDLFPKSQLSPGDIWYVYFRENSNTPIFGLLSASEWNGLRQELENGVEPPVPRTERTVEARITGTLTETEPPHIQNHSSKKSASSYRNRRFDEEKQKKNAVIGKQGEQFVLAYEKMKLIAAGRGDLADKVDWVANDCDGFGYDIISYDTDTSGNPRKIFIEVKTTQGDINQPFFISANEVAVSHILCDDYFIYRVFNYKDHSSDCSFYKVCGSVDDNFQLNVIQYLASKKENN